MGEEFEAYREAADSARPSRSGPPAAFAPAPFVAGPAFVPLQFIPTQFVPPNDFECNGVIGTNRN